MQIEIIGILSHRNMINDDTIILFFLSFIKNTNTLFNVSVFVRTCIMHYTNKIFTT